MPSTILLKSGSFKTIEDDILKRTLKGSIEINSKSKDNEDGGWTLVPYQKRRHQATSRIRLRKPRVMGSNADQLQLSKRV